MALVGSEVERYVERSYLDEIVKRLDERHATFSVQVAEAKAASNEWRGALSDRERETVSRKEFEAALTAVYATQRASEAKAELASATNAAMIAALGSDTSKNFENLRLSRAEAVGATASADRLRVFILSGLTGLSIVFGIVMAVIAANR